jgi:hypothetical protein
MNSDSTEPRRRPRLSTAWTALLWVGVILLALVPIPW